MEKTLMHKENMSHNITLREKWIDYSKLFLCFIVVFRHLLQGLNKANIPWNQEYYSFIDILINFFYTMPLFMCLSGYLYKKTKHIDSINDYLKFIKKKIISLGVPYVSFYMLHIGLNIIFSDSVNTQLGMKEILGIFTNPISPFWFLYALFFIFLWIPLIEKMCKHKTNITLTITGILLLISYQFKTNIYAIDVFMKYSFYFYLGVVFYDVFKEKNVKLNLFIIILIYWTCVAVFWNFHSKFKFTNQLLFSILAVFSIWITINLFKKMSEKLEKIKIWNFLSKYTLQIYLLHTIFAAGMRILCLKVGISNFYIQFFLGLISGMIGPVVIALIAEKTKYLNILFFPIKTFQILQEEHNQK